MRKRRGSERKTKKQGRGRGREEGQITFLSHKSGVSPSYVPSSCILLAMCMFCACVWPSARNAFFLILFMILFMIHIILLIRFSSPSRSCPLPLLFLILFTAFAPSHPRLILYFSSFQLHITFWN